VIVVDTNILVCFYIRSEQSDLADKAFLKDPHWIVPLLWRSEFRNVLASCIRKRLVNFEIAVEIIGEAERLMEGGEYSVSSMDVLNLAARSRCSSYDCEFVALARELNIPLVTTDEQILSDFPDISVRLAEFTRSSLSLFALIILMKIGCLSGYFPDSGGRLFKASMSFCGLTIFSRRTGLPLPTSASRVTAVPQARNSDSLILSTFWPVAWL
jgi:predicted nucleic acid-binding protein